MDCLKSLAKRTVNQQAMFSCNTLTSEYKTPKELAALIPPDANYHVVPLGNSQSTYMSPWYIAEAILRQGLSKNKIIDVCLPLEGISGQNKQSTPSRFIFHQNQLKGIRVEVKYKQRSRRRLVESYKVPKSLMKYQSSEQVPMGEFYLHLQNSKIAPLFESEVKDFPGILQQYVQMGCEVYSIVGNLPFANQKHDEVRERINQFCQSYHRVVIYSSMLYAPTHKELYTGGSYIKFDSETIQSQEVSIYEQSETIKGCISLTNLKQATDYSKLNYRPALAIKNVDVNYSLNCRREGPVRKFRKERSFVLVNQNIQQYHVWHLFNKLNGGTPFYVSNRPDGATKGLVHCMNNICNDIQTFKIATPYGFGLSYTSMLRKMIVMYKYSSTVGLKDPIWDKVEAELNSTIVTLGNITEPTLEQLTSIYDNLLSSQKMEEGIYLYTRNEMQIQAIRATLANKNDCRVTLCQKIDWLSQQRQGPRTVLKPQVIESQAANLQEAVKGYLLQSKSYRQVYSKIYSGCQPQQIKDIYTTLIPKILRLEDTNSMLYDYFVNNDWQFHQSQHIEFQNNIDSFIKDNIAEDKKAQSKVDLCKKLKQEKRGTCHVCGVQYPLDKKVTISCSCSQVFCLDCLGSAKMVPEVGFKGDCQVCLRKCTCLKCTKTSSVTLRPFQKQCHRCCFSSLKHMLNTKLSKHPTIECTRDKCEESFCVECISSKENNTKLTLLQTASWECYVCRDICDCSICEAKRHNIRVQNQIMNQHAQQKHQYDQTMAREHTPSVSPDKKLPTLLTQRTSESDRPSVQLRNPFVRRSSNSGARRSPSDSCSDRKQSYGRSRSRSRDRDFNQRPRQGGKEHRSFHNNDKRDAKDHTSTPRSFNIQGQKQREDHRSNISQEGVVNDTVPKVRSFQNSGSNKDSQVDQNNQGRGENRARPTDPRIRPNRPSGNIWDNQSSSSTGYPRVQSGAAQGRSFESQNVSNTLIEVRKTPHVQIDY